MILRTLRVTFRILTLRTSPLNRSRKGSCPTISTPLTVFLPAFQIQDSTGSEPLNRSSPILNLDSVWEYRISACDH